MPTSPLSIAKASAPPAGALRRAVAEALGTALLLVAIVGSGILGERLSAGNDALALLANSIATGAALVALISCFEPLSGAHFNPFVSLVEAWRGRLRRRELPGYAAAQVAGALVGVVLAHVLFDEPLLSPSSRARAGFSQAASEFLASFGLLAVVSGVALGRPGRAPFAVGTYVAAAYWFTGSTGFANPAVTLARSLTDTFAGIRPADVPPFVLAQFLGALAAALLFRWLAPTAKAAESRAPQAQGVP